MQLVVDHITLLVTVLISAWWDIVLQNVPTKGNDCFLTWKTCIWHLWSGLRSVRFQCYGATVEEIEQDQDEEGIDAFVAFPIKSLEGFDILDGGVTTTVSGFMSVQPVADRSEDTTIETTDVGFTFAGDETEAASTNICIPHAEFPQGISVNDVSNESTPFLIGFDVLREHGLVIDYHYNRVSSHILKRYLPRAILPTGHLAVEMLLSIS